MYVQLLDPSTRPSSAAIHSPALWFSSSDSTSLLPGGSCRSGTGEKGRGTQWPWGLERSAWHELSVPVGNAGAVVPAASARPNLDCYGPILVPTLLHALTAGLMQRGFGKTDRKENKASSLLHAKPIKARPAADLDESCCCGTAEAGTRVQEGWDPQPTLR